MITLFGIIYELRTYAKCPEKLKFPGLPANLGNLENQGKYFENLENIFLTWNFPFNQNLKKIVSFN